MRRSPSPAPAPARAGWLALLRPARVAVLRPAALGVLLRAVVGVLLPAAVAGCLPWNAGQEAGPPGAAEPATTRHVPDGATAPLFGNLGEHRRPVTTGSALAQRYFDQALVLTYGFNHAEAARSFREAQRLDPGCAMCFWGEAYVLGPNINKPMDPADAPRAHAAASEAVRLAAKAPAVERALASALARRYAAEAPADRAPLDRAYAEAMRDVAARFPDDLDVQTLLAEALMDTMPWDYYLPSRDPKPEALEALAALERVLERDPHHPGALHYVIHLVEPSDTPERAEAAADRLRDLVPGAGHLVHMPAHIYLRVGRYHDASVANEKAAAADESYITQCRAQGFYPAAYYPHNIDFLQASAGFEGRSAVALETARKLRETIPATLVREVPIVEEFLPRYLYMLVRFGRWEAIAAEPRPAEHLHYVTGVWHYARGMAEAAAGRTPAARAELAALATIRDAWARSDFVFLSGSSPAQILGIAALVLEARIAGAEGDWTRASGLLRRAVSVQDGLPYTEPPPFYFPVREALGNALLRAGRSADAEAVYREQLEHTPRNGWSLHGLAASLRAQGRDAAAAETEARFREAWARADVELPGSVF